MKVTRRNFIGTSAAATAGMTLIPGIGNVVAGPLHRDPITGMPTIPYGAVYFRKSFPPREDWERIPGGRSISGSTLSATGSVVGHRGGTGKIRLG